jgi:hypothetical protein
MTPKVGMRIIALLDAIKADFPRRKKAAEELLKGMGLIKTLELKIESPVGVAAVPTFDPEVTRDLTPMLQARFEYAGSWKSGQDVWLSACQMASLMQSKAIRPYHRSLREDWDGSAPMVFSDERLTLFGITEGVPENLVYLAWATGGEEPEVWTYAGFDTHKFKDLEHYFNWCLERD